MSHYSPLIAALVTMLLTVVILFGKFGKKIKIQDIPNERSLHATPIPRIGGIALMAGLLSGWALMLTSLKWWILVPLIGLFIVSLLDDLQGLPVRKRLLAHFIAAAILVGGSGLFTSQGIIVALAVLLFAVWMTNLYNFMDGSDGLAGGMALIGFSMYGVAALFAHDDTQAMLNFTIGAAALGFLFNNFPPAKMFMGDAGSVPLGFLAFAMGLLGWQQDYWAAWFPLLVFSPFVVDASVTLTKRVLCREKFWVAHREHYYQRLVQVGWGHRNVALLEYGLMLGSGVSALFALGQTFPWPLFLVWAGIYALLMLGIEWRWSVFNKTNH